MTSEARRFPLGLSLAAACALAILIGLGVWQLGRAGWKTVELARIARLQRAPPLALQPLLVRAASGTDVELTRIVVRCQPAPPAMARLLMTTDHGQWIARALSPCRLARGPYVGVLADRGFLAASRGSTEPPAPVLAAPGLVTGVLFPAVPSDGPVPAGFAPYVIAVEAERPPAPGLEPAPYAADAASKLEYVGTYAPTWFGLAGVLVCVYAALLWRRHHPKP